ncbi:MAG: hypothetical protein ACREEL_01225 [Stellaceae bacterium]
MTKPLTFVVLAALILALADCVADPPQQTSGADFAAPSDTGGGFAPWMVPVRFLD